MFLTPFILELRIVLVANLVISGILSSIFLILALCTSFLTIYFLINHLVYVNQQEQVLIYQHLIYLFFFRLLKLLGTFFNLSISNLSILDLKLDKSNFIADFDESTPIVSFKSAFFA